MPLALTGSSSAVKDNRSYKEVQELLLLHRRYEEKAVRVFRKGLSDANRADEKHANNRPQPGKQLANPASSNGLTETRARRKKPSTNLHDEDLSKPIYLNDQEYLQQLLLKSDANRNILDEHIVTHSEDRAQLILPKLEGIPPENKEIFYTTLPKMPPLPKIKDSKVNTIKLHSKKKRNRQYSRNEPSTFTAETCLTVRQLPRDHFMLHDSSSISAVPQFPRITPPREIELSSEAITTDEGHLWLVPFVNIEIPPYRLAKWNELENGSYSTEGVRHKEMQNGVSSDKREIENSQPKYKRNVHFSEFLHEIHLYSPISTQSTKSAKEDGNDINN